MEDSELPAALKNIQILQAKNGMSDLKDLIAEYVRVGQEYYFNRGQFSTALGYFTSAIQVSQRIKSIEDEIYSSRFKAVSLTMMRDYQNAKYLLQECLLKCSRTNCDSQSLQFQRFCIHINISFNNNEISFQRDEASLLECALLDSESLSHLIQAEEIGLRLIESGQGHDFVGECRNHMVLVYQNMGICYQRLEKVDKYIDCLKNQAALLQLMCKKEELCACVRLILTLLETNGSNQEHIFFLNILVENTDSQYEKFQCLLSLSRTILEQNISAAISAYRRCHILSFQVEGLSSSEEKQRLEQLGTQINLLSLLSDNSESLSSPKFIQLILETDYKKLELRVKRALRESCCLQSSFIYNQLLGELCFVQNKDLSLAYFHSAKDIGEEISGDMSSILNRIAACEIDIYNDHETVEIAIENSLTYSRSSGYYWNIISVNQAVAFFSCTGDEQKYSTLVQELSSILCDYDAFDKRQESYSCSAGKISEVAKKRGLSPVNERNLRRKLISVDFEMSSTYSGTLCNSVPPSEVSIYREEGLPDTSGKLLDSPPQISSHVLSQLTEPSIAIVSHINGSSYQTLCYLEMVGSTQTDSHMKYGSFGWLKKIVLGRYFKRNVFFSS